MLENKCIFDPSGLCSVLLRLRMPKVLKRLDLIEQNMLSFVIYLYVMVIFKRWIFTENSHARHRYGQKRDMTRLIDSSIDYHSFDLLRYSFLCLKFY